MGSCCSCERGDSVVRRPGLVGGFFPPGLAVSMTTAGAGAKAADPPPGMNGTSDGGQFALRTYGIECKACAQQWTAGEANAAVAGWVALYRKRPVTVRRQSRKCRDWAVGGSLRQKHCEVHRWSIMIRRRACSTVQAAHPPPSC